jgi:hypothetical protein
MTLATGVSLFAQVDLPPSGGQTDDRINWANRAAQGQWFEEASPSQLGTDLFDTIDLTFTSFSAANLSYTPFSRVTNLRFPLFSDATDLSFTSFSQLNIKAADWWRRTVPAPSLATPSTISINWTRLSRAGLTPEAYSQLLKIATRNDGWRGPGSRALRSLSFVGFLNFWPLICVQAVEPEFTLLPNGNLGAEWYKNSQRHLDMEFIDAQMAYFGFFSGATEIEGKANIQVIAQLLTSNSANPLRWKSR